MEGRSYSCNREQKKKGKEDNDSHTDLGVGHKERCKGEKKGLFALERTYRIVLEKNSNS